MATCQCESPCSPVADHENEPRQTHARAQRMGTGKNTQECKNAAQNTERCKSLKKRKGPRREHDFVHGKRSGPTCSFVGAVWMPFGVCVLSDRLQSPVHAPHGLTPSTLPMAKLRNPQRKHGEDGATSPARLPTLQKLKTLCDSAALHFVLYLKTPSNHPKPGATCLGATHQLISHGWPIHGHLEW